MGWSLIKKLFGRGMLASRKRGRGRTQKKILWRNPPRFEPLEDRTAPAGDLLATLTVPPQPLLNDSASETAVVSADTLVRQLVIVDAATPNYQQLLGDLGAGNLDAAATAVVMLDAHGDGIAAIAQILSQYHNLDALHIVSHGEAGAVKLGTALLDTATLPFHANSLRAWSAALKDTGDILFYGCDVAGNADGRLLVDEIHQLTGRDVAASTDTTGSALLGGDWTLEFSAGRIETPVPFSDRRQAEWNHVLDIYDLFIDGATAMVGPVADLAVTKTDGLTHVRPGDTISYTITVTNNGPTTVRAIQLDDTLPAQFLPGVSYVASAGTFNAATGEWTGLTLTQGRSATLTVTGTISPAATPGQLTNSVFVSPLGLIGDNIPGNNTATDIDTIVVPSITVDKTGPATIAEGNPVAYSFTITNTSPVDFIATTITSVVDDKLGDLTSAAQAAWLAQGNTGQIVLAQNQVFTFTFTTVTALDAGTVVNLVTVNGHDDKNIPVSASDTASVTVANVAPTITVDKAGPATIVEGNTATFNFAITNTSPASTDPVTITSVVDNVLGNLTAAAQAAWLAQGHSGPITLARNQAFTFSYATATARNAGTVVNTVTVSGQDDENTPATAQDSHTLTVGNVAPTIDVDKFAANIAEGQSATYTFVVTNTSPASTDPVTLTSVNDDVFGDLTPAAQAAWVAQGHSGPIVLAPGAVFSFTYATAAINAGAVSNVVTIVGHDDENTQASASAGHTLAVSNVAPAIAVDKTGPATLVEGQSATYSFVITNTSAASTDPVTITSVADSVLGNLTAAANAAWVLQGHTSPIVLAQSQSFTFSVTTGALNAGTVVNVVTVTGRDDENTLATAQDSHTLTVTNVAPSITVAKSGPTTIAEGNTATYSFVITNTSTVSTDPVTIISVVDSVLGNLTAAAQAANGGNPIVLAPGASFAFSFTTISALNAGTMDNLVTVAARDNDNTLATAQDSHSLTVTDVAPSITVDKSGPTTISEGQAATYNFAVTNTSTASTDPVTITSVVDDVYGDLTATANAAWLAQGHSGPIILTRGQSFTFSFTTAALNAGTVDNTVTVTGLDDESTPASASDTHTLLVSNLGPVVLVDKTGPATIVEGQTATYSFTITNASQVSTEVLIITSVVDDVLGDLTSAALAANDGNPIVLAQNQAFTFSCTTVSVLNAGTVVNVVSVSGLDDDDTPFSATDSATVTVTNVAPGITVDVAVPPTLPEGLPATIGLTITNTSPASTDPVTITSVVALVGDRTAAAEAAWLAQGHTGPIILAPGESFSFNYITVVAAPNAGVTINGMVTVTGHDDENNQATAFDTASVTMTNVAPTITVVGTVPATVPEGAPIPLEFTITNTSPASTDPVTITSVVVTGLGDLISVAQAAWLAQGNSGPIVLAQNESFAFSFITPPAPTAGPDGVTLDGTVTVIGHDDEDTQATATDTGSTIVTDVAPSITVDGTVPATIPEGEPVTLGFTITNTSPASTDPVTITSVVVPGLGDLILAAEAAWLAQGNSGPIVLAQNQSFTFDFTTPPAPNAGITLNGTVTVTGHDDENTEATATDTESTTVTNVAPTITVEKTGSAFIFEGNTATYSFAITNTSPATTDPVTITSVVDNVLGDLTAAANAAWALQGHTGPIVLAQFQTFSFDYTSAPFNAGTVVNLVSVAGLDDEDTQATAQDSFTLSVRNVAPTITVAKTGPGEIVEGNTATYSFVITNTSLASTDPVTITSVVDNLLGDLTSAAQAAWLTQGNSGQITLAPNASFTFSFTTATALDAGTVVNQVTVSGHDDENTAVSASATASVTVTDETPSITVDKSGPGDIPEGNTATYSFTITNTSPASTDPVTITSVVDNVLGNLTAAAQAAWVIQGNSAPITLAPDVSFTFSYTTVTALNAVDSPVVNVVTVKGRDDENTAAPDATATALVTVTNEAPSITVDKTGPTTIPEGQTATFNFTITNTSLASTDPVTITSVVDDVYGDLTATANAAWLAQGHMGPIELAQNQSFTFSFATAVLTPGTVTNTVIVAGLDDENTLASASDTHTLLVSNLAPVVLVDKTGPATIAEGQTATYTFTITNASPGSTQSVTITSVVDDVLGDLTAAAQAAYGGELIVLTPDQSLTFSYTTVTALNAGTVVNVVTVSGLDDDGAPFSATDSATVTVTNVLPTITVDVAVPPTVSEGLPATIGLTITNTSPASTDPVTITSVVALVGDRTAAANAAWVAAGHTGPIFLQPGESFSFDYITVVAAPNAGVTINGMVTVTGHDDENTEATAFDTASVTMTNVAPTITVVGTVPATVPEGEPIPLDFVITNTSPAITDPVTITSVVVPGLGDLITVAQAAWLAQGHTGPIVLMQNQSFTFSFTTPPAPTAGPDGTTLNGTVTVTGHDDEDNQATASDAGSTIVTDVAPSISVDGIVPPTVPEGMPVTLGFTITNTSPASTDPVTITSVFVDLVGDLILAAEAAWAAQGNSGPIVLAQGESFTFDFTTPPAPNAGITVNGTVTVTGHDDENTEATATDAGSTIVTNVAPSISVDKTGPAAIVEGNTATYTFVITNTSPATTDPVTVTSVVDDKLGNLTSAAQAAWLAQGNSGQITLAQNQVFTFTFTTATALDAGTVVNVVSVAGRDDENTQATATDSHTLTVTVNDPPVAVDDRFSVDVSGHNLITGDISQNDSDPNGDAIRVTAVNGIAVPAEGTTIQLPNGTLTIRSDGTFSYSFGNRQLTDSFTYTLTDANGLGSNPATVTLVRSQVSGWVYLDSNNNGVRNVGERGLAGVYVVLSGTDDRGQSVRLVTRTNAKGLYVFANLRKGRYTIKEIQPKRFVDGKDTPGTINGRRAAATGVNDLFFVLLGEAQSGINFNFGERMSKMYFVAKY